MSDMDSGNGGMSVTGFLLGAVVGAGIALLLAPSPGGDTRRKLGETARRLGSRASDLIGHGGEEDQETHSAHGGHTGERNAGGQAGEPFRSGGRREPMGGRTPGTAGA